MGPLCPHPRAFLETVDSRGDWKLTNSGVECLEYFEHSVEEVRDSGDMMLGSTGTEVYSSGVVFSGDLEWRPPDLTLNVKAGHGGMHLSP